MEKMSARKNQTSFRLVSWNLAGLAEDSMEPFLACTSLTMRWDVLLLQETFRKLEGLETEGCQIFTPGNLPGRAHGGWRCPAIILKSRICEECVLLGSGDRWVAIKMQTSNRVLISAHLPTIKAPLEDFNVPLHEIESLIRKFPDHEVILGVDANTKVFSFEDGWHVGPCTKPAKLTSKEKERFSEFLTRTGLVLANTWGRAFLNTSTRTETHRLILSL